MKQQLIRFDWAMKRLLRNKTNFDILEGFLSELLKEDIRIQQILESESNKTHTSDKQNRVDLLVEDTNHEFLIIEIQNETEHDYLQRLLYGTSKVITENMYKGMAYSEIKKVISVSIVYFDLGQGEDYVYGGKTNFIGLHNNDVLKLSQTQVKLYGDKEIYQLFPEYYLIKVNNFNQVAKDNLDEWIYFLKNEDIRPEFKAKGIQKAKEEFAVMKLSEQEYRDYNEYLDGLSYQASIFESSYTVGQIEVRYEVAKKCILKGYNNEIIVELSDLTIDKIEEIRLKLLNS